MSGLDGRTVVVTRRRIDGNDFARKLAGRGARPVLFPTIDIHPVADFTLVDREIARMAGYDWLVFTSVHAVTFTWSRMRTAGVTWPRAARVAAIGPVTAAALVNLGARVDCVPHEHRGVALPGTMGGLNGLRVLLPIADIGRDETAGGMRDAGAVVTDVAVYCTAPAVADQEGLAVLRAGADAVTFTSPSTVQNFAVLVGTETSAVLEHTVVACIGPATADAVRQIGVDHPVVATPYTTDGLIELLDECFVVRAETGGRL